MTKARRGAGFRPLPSTNMRQHWPPGLALMRAPWRACCPTWPRSLPPPWRSFRAGSLPAPLSLATCAGARPGCRASAREDCRDAQRRHFNIYCLGNTADGDRADDGAADHNGYATAPADIPWIAVVADVKAGLGVSRGTADINRWFSFASGGPCLVRSDEDRRQRCAVHTHEGD